MEIQEICEFYKITTVNGLYCLNDIAKNIVKMKLDNLLQYTKDKKKIGNKYFIDGKIFYKIIYNHDNDECRNIINMLNGKYEEKDGSEELQILKLQYKIECEKTKQLELTQTIRVIEIKTSLFKKDMSKLDRLKLLNDTDDSSDVSTDSESNDTDTMTEDDSYEEIDIISPEKNKHKKAKKNLKTLKN